MPSTVSEFASKTLLSTPIVSVRDVCCQGLCRHKSPEEYATATHLVFPYRGAYVRHLGQDEAVAEANQVLFFNRKDAYQVSHPVRGGDSCLSLQVDEELLRELTPKALLRDGPTLAFREQRMPIDPRAQALVALLRHSLDKGIAEPLEAESLALTLVRRTLRPQAIRARPHSIARQRLVDRAKLLLTSDLSRRWTLADIAAEVGGSAVYLTQVFQQLEGMPLYRYQLNLRLARALDLIAEYDDLTVLGLELGFSSHSHFTSAFQRTYGRSPSEFRRFALNR
jgi:AraC family transcriptional regulator